MTDYSPFIFVLPFTFYAFSPYTHLHQHFTKQHFIMKKTRHGFMRGGLAALLAYREKPEGPVEPVKTNWSVTPANDNQPMPDMDTDRRHEIVPSIEEIMREAEHEPTRNESGQIIAIGRLRFSDGTQFERIHVSGPNGKVIRREAPAPVGAMLYTRERLTRERGPAQEPRMPAGRLAEMMGVKHRDRIPAIRKPRAGKSYTKAEAKAEIAAAIANTKNMPAVTVCSPGLPAATDTPSDCFLGMTKERNGEGGAIAWEDISSAMAEREMWQATMDDLSVRDRDALDAAMDADNVTQVGESAGFGAEYSRRKGGMRALLAANDNLSAALKKSA